LKSDQRVSTLLSVVADVFDLSWGVTITPGIPHDGRKVRLTIGDVIEVRPPNSKPFHAKVHGIPMGGRTPCTPITLDPEVKASMIPVGSELWISDSAILPDDSTVYPTDR
jgi:hypothetical protein